MRRPIVALVVAATLAACSGGGGDAPAKDGAPVTGAGVAAIVPEGWTSRVVDGATLVIARDPADVRVEFPGGPRLVATAAVSSPLDVEALAPSDDEARSVLDGVERIAVDGRPAVAIDATRPAGGSAVVGRTIIVKLADGRAYTFTLEAPGSAWAADRATLEAIVQSVRFV